MSDELLKQKIRDLLNARSIYNETMGALQALSASRELDIISGDVDRVIEALKATDIEDDINQQIWDLVQ